MSRPHPPGSPHDGSAAGGPDSDADGGGGDGTGWDSSPEWPLLADGARLVAFVADLMDRSRISAARPEVRFLTSPAELEGLDPTDVALVDLGRPAARARLASCPARVIGFVAHVQEELAHQARQDGAEEVLARSVFFRRLRGPGDRRGQDQRPS